MILENAYLARLIDGEGTITITLHRQYNRPHWICKTFIWVSNTDAKLVKLLKKRHGGACGLKAKAISGRKAALYWRVMSHSDIHRILTQCLPFLTVKKQRAEILLKFVESRIASNGGRYTNRELRLQKKIRELNRRGIK